MNNDILDNILKTRNARLEIISGESVIYVDRENLKALLRDLRDDVSMLFVMLMSVCVVDYPEREKRFEVVYSLLSLKYNERLRIKVLVKDGESVISIDDLYSSANWFEREAYDMFGVVFEKSKDLRRILTDYNFEHFPLRKDFPLTGYEEVHYDEQEKKVKYRPVKLDQEYRNFDFLSSWGGSVKETD